MADTTRPGTALPQFRSQLNRLSRSVAPSPSRVYLARIVLVGTVVRLLAVKNVAGAADGRHDFLGRVLRDEMAGAGKRDQLEPGKGSPPGGQHVRQPQHRVPHPPERSTGLGPSARGMSAASRARQPSDARIWRGNSATPTRAAAVG